MLRERMPDRGRTSWADGPDIENVRNREISAKAACRAVGVETVETRQTAKPPHALRTSAIVRSLSAFSSPMKAMPRIGMRAAFQGLDREQRVIDRSERGRAQG